MSDRLFGQYNPCLLFRCRYIRVRTEGNEQEQNRDKGRHAENRNAAKALLISLYGVVLFGNGEGGIRTHGTAFIPYTDLANRRFQPLSHLSNMLLYKYLRSQCCEP
jgi:hypothetical protein